MDWWWPYANVKFKSMDVLQEPDIREGIKSFSDWPTIPQLYVKGEFVGGGPGFEKCFYTYNCNFTLSSKEIFRL